MADVLFAAKNEKSLSISVTPARSNITEFILPIITAESSLWLKMIKEMSQAQCRCKDHWDEKYCTYDCTCNCNERLTKREMLNKLLATLNLIFAAFYTSIGWYGVAVFCFGAFLIGLAAYLKDDY